VRLCTGTVFSIRGMFWWEGFSVLYYLKASGFFESGPSYGILPTPGKNSCILRTSLCKDKRSAPACKDKRSAPARAHPKAEVLERRPFA